MRITTSDGLFGFLVERTPAPKFFVFQLVMNGQVLGDREPCILGTAMQQLRALATVAVAALPSNEASASKLLTELQANDDWNDATLLPLAESLDAWRVRGFMNGSTVTFLAQQSGMTEQSGPLILASIPLSEYEAIIAAVLAFWAADDSRGP